MAQWLRICLPMQGTWVRSLVREDPTYRGATKPVRCNYWAYALEPTSHNYWAREPQLLSPRATTTEVRVPQLLKPAHLEPVLHTREATTMRSLCTTRRSSPHSPQLEKAHVQQQRPNSDKNKQNKNPKKQLLVSLIFSTIFLVSVPFIFTLIFISFLLGFFF